MTHKEVVSGEGRQLQRIFQQTGTRGKTRSREAPHSGVVLHHRVANAIKIQAVALRQHIELIGNREIKVAPAIRKKLGKLGLEWRQVNGAGGNFQKKPPRPRLSFRFKSRDDLRQSDQFLQRFPLGDSFWAESQVNLAGAAANAVINKFRYSGVHRAPQDQQRIIRHLLEQSVKILIQVSDGRIE